MDNLSAYSSHLPILRWALSGVSSGLIVEDGAGQFSTPLFQEWVKEGASRRFISIEADPNFITRSDDLICIASPWTFHALTLPQSLEPDEKIKIKNWYLVLRELLATQPCALLFVDGHVATRLDSLSVLYSLFKIVVIHDTEPWFRQNYMWSEFCPTDEYDLFNVVPKLGPWTGVLLHKSIQRKVEVEGYTVEPVNRL